jgi:hypothetical protein
LEAADVIGFWTTPRVFAVALTRRVVRHETKVRDWRDLALGSITLIANSESIQISLLSHSVIKVFGLENEKQRTGQPTSAVLLSFSSEYLST